MCIRDSSGSYRQCRRRRIDPQPGRGEQRLKFQLPLPLIEAPPPRPPWEDFKLLLAAQWQVAWNKMRHWPKINLIAMIILGLGVLALLVFLGKLAYGALVSVPPQDVYKRQEYTCITRPRRSWTPQSRHFASTSWRKHSLLR